MPCTCIDTINEKLAPLNGLLAKFCPFCGTAYTPPETKPMGDAK